MSAKRQAFAGLFERLVRHVEEPRNEQDCWRWGGVKRGRTRGYPRLNIRARGNKHKQIGAHRAMLVLMELEGETELFFDLYELYSVAAFEADHLCIDCAHCINPDHLHWMTPEEHAAKTRAAGQGIYRGQKNGDE